MRLMATDESSGLIRYAEAREDDTYSSRRVLSSAQQCVASDAPGDALIDCTQQPLSEILDNAHVQSQSSCYSKQPRPRPVFPAKQAQDVAAALRFRLVLEQCEFSQSVAHLSKGDDSGIPGQRSLVWNRGSPGITKSRLTRVRDSQSVMKRKNKPSSLQLHLACPPIPPEIKSAPLPQEGSSPRYLDAAKSRGSLRRSNTISVLKSESYRVFGGGRTKKIHRQKSEVPPLPLQPHLIRESGWRLQGLDHPEAPAVKSDRTNLQRASFEDAPAVYETGANARLVPEAINVRFGESRANQIAEQVTTIHGDSENEHRKNKSLFHWLRRRSELEELIEMYMDDDQLDAINLERRNARPRWITIWPI